MPDYKGPGSAIPHCLLQKPFRSQARQPRVQQKCCWPMPACSKSTKDYPKAEAALLDITK